MRRFFRYLLMALVLLTVMLVSAMTAMRLAIHGREVVVPKLVGLSAEQAERIVTANGLLMDQESRFYSNDVPEGHVVTQLPPPGIHVRRGWRMRVAISLGPQRAVVPDLVGQSPRAAEINVRRRGLDVGDVAVAHLPGAPADQVVAQSPPPNAANVTSPKVSLLVSAPPQEQAYVMPSLVGHSIEEATQAVEAAGLRVGGIVTAETGVLGVVLRQYPPPGQRVTPGMAVTFEVAKQPPPNP